MSEGEKNPGEDFTNGDVIPDPSAIDQAPLTGGEGHAAKIAAHKEQQKKKARAEQQARQQRAGGQPNAAKDPVVAAAKKQAAKHVQGQRPQVPAAADAMQQAVERNLLDDANRQIRLRVADQQRPALYKYYLVIVPDDGWPRVEKFDDLPTFLEAVKQYLDQPVCLFPFMGTHFPITKAPHRFLITHEGPVPLFEIPSADELESEPDGWIGPPRPESTIPTADAVYLMDDEDEEEVDEAPEAEAAPEASTALMPPPPVPPEDDPDETPVV